MRPSEAGVEVGGARSHLDRRPCRAQRIVLMGERHTERPHHGIPDELLDSAAMALDGGPHRLEVAIQQLAQRLGVKVLPEFA